jgi:L-serine dehydratase
MSLAVSTRNLRVSSITKRGLAWTGFMIASNEIPANRHLDFDTTVTAMALTAKEVNAKYKETSEGGLAVSVTLC